MDGVHLQNGARRSCNCEVKWQLVIVKLFSKDFHCPSGKSGCWNAKTDLVKRRVVSIAATLRMLLVNPPWVTKLSFGNALAKLVQNGTLRDLFKTGSVTWGHVIQANEELFSAAPDSDSYTYDRAGEVVFGVHRDRLQSPLDLQSVSDKLASLKYSCDLDSDLQPWADYLVAETIRVVGWQVPSKLSAQSSCFVSTTLFRRSHLPTGVLLRPFFPLVVANRQPYFAMPLPKHYWPKELLHWWSAD